MQYSKILPAVSTIIFIFVLLFSFFGTYFDSTVIIGALTASGSVALTSIVFYMKNSWIEKVSRVKIEAAKCISQERLNYNKEMLLFLKENNLTQADLEQVENGSLMDEMESESMESISMSINDDMSEASTSPEVQNIII